MPNQHKVFSDEEYDGLSRRCESQLLSRLSVCRFLFCLEGYALNAHGMDTEAIHDIDHETVTLVGNRIAHLWDLTQF